ncbi:MAG: PorT family protein [Flavobacteriales bacterium]|nr:PorT family protein [Flavobacteriales bacterium]MCB9167629.1 PorT family protein [Flavobacteriales bacterium]
MRTPILLVLCLGLPSWSLAQKGFSLGFRLGASYCNTPTAEWSTSTDWAPGGHAGVVAHYGFGKKGALATLVEAQFALQGSRPKNAVEDDHDRLFLYYANFPVLARYRLKMGLFFELGPYVGVLVNTGYRSATPEPRDPEDRAVYNEGIDLFTKSFNVLDYGTTLGVGYLPTSGLGASVRFNYGIADIWTSADAVTFEGLGTIDAGITSNLSAQLSFIYMVKYHKVQRKGHFGHRRHVLKR